MQHGNSRLLRRFTQTFTLVYPKQHLKFAMGTTKNKVIETIRNYPRSIGRENNRTEYHNKLESINEMLCLHSKERTICLMSK